MSLQAIPVFSCVDSWAYALVTFGCLFPSEECDRKCTVEPGANMSCNVFISQNTGGWFLV